MIKLVLNAAMLSMVAAVRMVPAGVSIQQCPNYPYCNISPAPVAFYGNIAARPTLEGNHMFRHTGQSNLMTRLYGGYNTYPSRGAQNVYSSPAIVYKPSSQLISTSMRTLYPAGLSPLLCPNYPFCPIPQAPASPYVDAGAVGKYTSNHFNRAQGSHVTPVPSVPVISGIVNSATAPPRSPNPSVGQGNYAFQVFYRNNEDFSKAKTAIQTLNSQHADIMKANAAFQTLNSQHADIIKANIPIQTVSTNNVDFGKTNVATQTLNIDNSDSVKANVPTQIVSSDNVDPGKANVAIQALKSDGIPLIPNSHPVIFGQQDLAKVLKTQNIDLGQGNYAFQIFYRDNSASEQGYVAAEPLVSNQVNSGKDNIATQSVINNNPDSGHLGSTSPVDSVASFGILPNAKEVSTYFSNLHSTRYPPGVDPASCPNYPFCQ